MKNIFGLFAFCTFSTLSLIAMQGPAQKEKSWDDLDKTLYNIPGMGVPLSRKYLSNFSRLRYEGQTIKTKDGAKCRFSWGNALFYIKEHDNKEAAIIERYSQAIALKAYEHMGSPVYSRQLKVPVEVLKAAQLEIDNNLQMLCSIFQGKQTIDECKQEWQRIQQEVMDATMDPNDVMLVAASNKKARNE